MGYMIKSDILNALKEDKEASLYLFRKEKKRRNVEDIIEFLYDSMKYEIERLPQYKVENVTVLEETQNKWISVKEKLPKDDDERFYMCLLENHLEDQPMFCQYEEEEGGFGLWSNIFDSATGGFVDSEFLTMKDLNCERVLYWMPMIDPPKDETK